MRAIKQIVDTHPQEGICNRVIKLILGLSNNADPSMPVYLNWRVGGDSWVEKRFYELFQFDPECKWGGVKVIEINKGYPISDIWGSDTVNHGEYRNIAPHYGSMLLDTRDGKVVDWDERSVNSIDKGFVYEAPEELLDHYRPYFSTILPSDDVKRRIDEVYRKCSNYVSVHVRLDKVWREWGRGGYGDVKKYISLMKRYPADTSFYLASCDKKAADLFKRSMPGQIIELPDKDYESDIDAVAELYLLSKGNELIASYGSSFSNTAWWLSDCKMKTTVIGDSSTWTHGGVPVNRMTPKRIVLGISRRLKRYLGKGMN